MKAMLSRVGLNELLGHPCDVTFNADYVFDLLCHSISPQFEGEPAARARHSILSQGKMMKAILRDVPVN